MYWSILHCMLTHHEVVPLKRQVNKSRSFHKRIVVWHCHALRSKGIFLYEVKGIFYHILGYIAYYSYLAIRTIATSIKSFSWAKEEECFFFLLFGKFVKRRYVYNTHVH